MKTVLFLICFSTAAYSQKGSIGLSLGASAPVSDFASSDIDNKYSGFADCGMYIDLHFSYMINRNIGVITSLTANINPLDEKHLQQNFEQENPGIIWQTSSDGWLSGGLLSGIILSFPVNEKVDFNIRTMVGFTGSVSPRINLLASGQGLHYSYTQEEAEASAMAYNIGAGLRYNKTPKIYVSLNADYFSSNPEFSVRVYDNSSYFNEMDLTQSIKAINVMLSFGYRFDFRHVD